MKKGKIRVLSAILSAAMVLSAFQFAAGAYTSSSDGEFSASTDGCSQTDTYEIYPVVQRMETNIVPASASVLIGDVNSDGVVNSVDATVVLQRYATIIDDTCEYYNPAAADTDGNSVVDSKDATLILQLYAGIIDAFGVDSEITESPNVFYVTDSVNIVYESGIDIYTQNFLEEVLTNYGRTFTVSEAPVSGKTNFLLGIDGSGEAADAYISAFPYEQITTENLFSLNDAYVLSAVDGTVAIVGKDTDAAFYGVSTLQMMFSSFAGKKFITAFIEDYATVEYRGFIEGMYARWDDEGRESLMRFARDVKMNTYVYASKTDVYHTSQCTELYPQEEIDAIAHLVQVGLETKCYYGWSFHLSGFLNGLDMTDETAYNEKFEKLIAKLQQLYDVGVRKFDVLNDDFGGGSYSDVVAILNRINEEFIIPNNCEPMTYCPQGYNKAWSSYYPTELAALCDLDDNIMIFWTGDDVNAPMTQSTIDYVAEQTGHDVCTWLNYPVNEHAKSGLFLGDITYYARDGVTGQRGALSNPCLYPEASKVALYQLACLWWNNSNYSSYATEIWENSFKYLEPEAYESYSTLAHNISNCPNSSRVSYFNESEYLAETLESVLNKVKASDDITSDAEVRALTEEFENIRACVDIFREECTNTALLDEMQPWLNSLADVSDACKYALESVIALQNGDTSAAWDSFSTASLKMSTWNTYSYTDGSGNTSYAQSGSLRLVPFANAVITEANSLLSQYLDPDSESLNMSFIGVVHGAAVTPGSESAKMIDGSDSTYAAFNQIQLVGDYVGVDLGKVTAVESIRILQGSTDTDHDIIHDGVLEYSVDGNQWTEIETVTSNYLHEIEGLDISARYIRLRVTGFNNPNNTSKLDYWVHIREFRVNYTQSSDCGVITNNDSLAQTTVTFDGNSVSAALPSDVSLAPGEYIGIDLQQAYFYSDLQSNISAQGLTVQYSANNVIWTDEQNTGAADTIRYVRLINSGSSDAELSGVVFALTLESAELSPVMLENNLSVTDLRGGAWENVFDGDVSTYVWTNCAQVAGQYITFDLGQEIPVYDIDIYFSDNPVKPRLYYAEIQLSADNSEWTAVKTFNNDLVNDYELSGDYRIAHCSGNGTPARYMRIYITQDGPDLPYIRIQEIEINNSVDSVNPVINGTLSGELENIVDGDLSTLYRSEEETVQGDYIRYIITDKTSLSSFTVIQNGANLSSALVSAVDGNGIEHTLGELTGSVNVFDVSNLDAVLEIKLTFPAGETPEIYEITKQIKK